MDSIEGLEKQIRKNELKQETKLGQELLEILTEEEKKMKSEKEKRKEYEAFKKQLKGFVKCHVCARLTDAEKVRTEMTHYESEEKVTLENGQVVPASEFFICKECVKALDEDGEVERIDENGNAVKRKNIFVRPIGVHMKYQARILLSSSDVRERKKAVVIVMSE